MAKSLSEFREIDGLDGIYTAENGSLRCSAVRLATGGLCLFSPVLGLGQSALASLADLGQVQFLLAPNHYHHKGLTEYRDAFPKASICAPPEARPRLEKVTGLQFTDLNALQAVLQNNMQLVAPLGLKTGEVWINVIGHHHRAWLVVDAFSGGKPGTTTGKPDMLGTFPKFGVGDRDTYLAWLEQEIRDSKPTMIVPCHGNMVHSPQLVRSLKLLIQKRL